MYIRRLAEENIKKSFENNKVLIILGARQVGKTTSIKHILSGKKAVFLNFDIENDKNRFMALSSLPPQEMLNSIGNPDFLVIDEAHKIAESSRIVKGWYDYGIKLKIILLGSSSFDLHNQSAESLAGRNEKIYLPQLVFKEVLMVQGWFSESFSEENIEKNFSKEISEMLLQRVVYGSYPEILAPETNDKESFLFNLVSDYLLKDVLQFGMLKEPDTIKKLLSLLAYQVGSEVSVNELAKNLSISRLTVDKYLDLLERAFVIFRLSAFSNNPRKEIMKSQKIFFWDTGIRNALLKEFSLSSTRPDIGALWENWVIAEFAKVNFLEGQKKNLYFWRSRSGSEVDLVIKDSEKMQAYEIKWSETNTNKKAFENQYGIKVSVISKSSVGLLIS